MTQAEKIVKIIMPDLIRYLKLKKSGELAQKRLDSRHPGNLNVMLSNRDARDMILSLQPKIAFSTGSACTSGIQEPSHVLKAIGLTTEEAEHSFRITVGRFSNMDDINTAIELISGRN